MGYIKAIDISRHNGDGVNAPLPDYKLIPKDIQLVIARSTVGNYYTDTTYTYHQAQCKMNNISFGTYIVPNFYYPVEENIDRVKEVLGNYPPKLIVADLEKGKKWKMPSRTIVTRGTLSFMRWLSDFYTDSEIVIYTADWYWKYWITIPNAFINYPLIFAQYPYEDVVKKKQYTTHKDFIGTFPRLANLPGKWKKYVGWQFSEKGKITGMSSKSTDLDIIRDTFFREIYSNQIVETPVINPNLDLMNISITKNEYAAILSLAEKLIDAK